MSVVIDTNVIVLALIRNHPFAVILEAWRGGKFVRSFSSTILLEYQTVLTRLSGPTQWHKLERMLELSARHSSNISQIPHCYFYSPDPADREDSKFAACAISLNAEYIITQDPYIKTLISSAGRPLPIRPEEFITRCLMG